MTLSETIRRVIAKASGKNYVEDFIRVYPNNVAYNLKGKTVSYTKEHHNNFLNHQKFYKFASQYVEKGKSAVLDAGCGSGYGAKILKEFGANNIECFDLSKHAIEYAQNHFSNFANFRTCGITDLSSYRGAKFDLVTCSEVLEHIKEYGREEEALIEIRGAMKQDGLLVLGTPNDEMLPNHGFSFKEIDSLFGSIFDSYLIIENSLLPPSQRLHLWEQRQSKGETGLCIRQQIKFNETVSDRSISSGVRKPGKVISVFEHDGIFVDTKNLHNTHSWVVVAKA